MKYLLIFILFNGIGICEEQYSYFKKGNDAMLDSRYDDAIESYKAIIELGYESGNLYYNLGNAYFRKDYIGKAIWAYYKSMEFYPRDNDVKHNISIAKTRIIDRIELPETLFLFEFYKNLRGYLTTTEWFLFGSILCLCISMMYLALNTSLIITRLLKMILPFFIMLGSCIHLIAFDSYFYKKMSKSAVIVENSVNAYSEPHSGKNTILFMINEGIVAKITNYQNDWSEIILIDGKKGWIETKALLPLK